MQDDRRRVLTVIFFGVIASTRIQGAIDEKVAKTDEPLPSISEKTKGFAKLDGFLPLYWDELAGKLWMEISHFDEELLMVAGLASGLGSNDIGLDRGQMGKERIVRFRRIGPKILMIEPNLRFRALLDDLDAARAVEDAFAPSVLFGFDVAAQDDRVCLVDATAFLLRDNYEIAPRLQPGAYHFDESRSAVHLTATIGFPDNTELEILATFVRSGDQPRDERPSSSVQSSSFFEGVEDVAASAEAVTLRIHHSFIRLPDDPFVTRSFDPRSGFGSYTFRDYTAPLSDPMTRRFIPRHRLEKKDPSAPISEPVRPIVYYVDRGAPEPLRSALLDGARWWNQAFEAAGYRDAFRVELLPAEASSLDVRYNVINWVHRSTRGWSYGGSIIDPRTGEILKGVVTLGSLRARQDYLIAEGLLAPYENGEEVPQVLSQWALARVRQLSAHEVGHTLGLDHNYYDSSLGRISVMDYPHPLVTLADEASLRYDDVYDVGIGEWDKVAITWGYADFPNDINEAHALDEILEAAWKKDIRYLTNQDIDHNPRADQWSNGTDVATELLRMLEVRRVALTRFGERAIRRGFPLATLEEVLVPLYMHHRYQVEATASAVGGVHYDTYAMRGDGKIAFARVPGEQQRAAVDALLVTLDPALLAIPRSILDLIPPRPPGYQETRELFPRDTGGVFDALSPAVVAANHTLSTLLRDDRCVRVVEQHLLDTTLPGLDEILRCLVDTTFASVLDEEPYEQEIRRSIQRIFAEHLMTLAQEATTNSVRAAASLFLEDLANTLAATNRSTSPNEYPHRRNLARNISQFLEHPTERRVRGVPHAPPGAPIGEPACDGLQED